MPHTPTLPDLPVGVVLKEVLAGLVAGNDVVLVAPPGAGKTTCVPLALLDAGWRNDRKILVLEPRRLAARAAAHRMAHLLGEQVGQTVGYRVRMDTRVGQNTVIEVVTEGILTRMLQSDPELTGVAAILFDEFHERSIHADLALALTLDVRAAVRPDLRLVVMSATLDDDRVASVLPRGTVIRSEGRAFEVETHWSDEPLPRFMEDAVVPAVRRALAETEGDILVFLPGAGEIRRVEERLAATARAQPGEWSDNTPALVIRPLHGSLSFDAQDAALQPTPPGQRKVVLATDIAETSLTIDGIRVVIDSGMRRVPVHDPGTGLTSLATRPISQASANQRRGRAGRTAPGVCYRLWTRLEESHRAPYDRPEILDADLAPLALELACWGVGDPSALTWLDAPPETAWQEAHGLLRMLEAVGGSGGATPHGRRMAGVAAHPRLAHMILAADDPWAACGVAAVLTERDRAGIRQVDLGDPRRWAGVRDAARDFASAAGCRPGPLPPEPPLGPIVALAFPERVAQRVTENEERGRGASKGGNKGAAAGSEVVFRMQNGQLVHCSTDDPLARSAFLAVASTGGAGPRSRIFLAAPLSGVDVRRLAEGSGNGSGGGSGGVELVSTLSFDPTAERVVARLEERWGALVLKSGPDPAADPMDIAHVLCEEIRSRGLHVLPWEKESRQVADRLRFLHARDPEWPDRSEETLHEWLEPHLVGMASLTDLKRVDLVQALLSGVDRQAFERRAPARIQVPSGSRIAVDWSSADGPVLAVRLQEVFGMTRTPMVDDGKVPVVLHLLSPAHRPVQVTTDLAGFWTSSYHDVRKDMRGRYPKHWWPENPLDAEPTTRTIKRNQ
ncbi:MAG: ATP-dependent helicase HrpB [Rhodothermales bacterium]